MLLAPVQLPDALQLEALLELQVRRADCPLAIFDDDTDRFAAGDGGAGGGVNGGAGVGSGFGSGDGTSSGTGSGVAPCATAAPVSPVKFSSVLHPASTNETQSANDLLENAVYVTFEFVMSSPTLKTCCSITHESRTHTADKNTMECLIEIWF